MPGRIKVLRDADGDGKPETVERLRHRPTPAVRDRVLSAAAAKPTHLYVGNTDSVVRFAYKNGDTKAAGRARDDRPEHSERPRAGWAAAATGPATSSSRRTARRMFVSVGSRSNVERRPEREAPGRYPGLRPRRQEREDLRLGHPQRRRPGDPSRDRPALGVGQRARRAGRPPGARLRHPRRGRRLLRLALVLPRPAPGPAPQGQAPRAQGQGDRARRPGPVALGIALHDLLHGRTVPARSIASMPSPPSTARGTAPAAPATRSSASR